MHTAKIYIKQKSKWNQKQVKLSSYQGQFFDFWPQYTHIVCYIYSHLHVSVSCGLTSWITFDCLTELVNWRAPWKNRISSTSMKLRKSLIKPVMWQNISSCSVLSPEIVMHDAFNVTLWTSADIGIVVHDDVWWKNQTTQYILPCHWLYEWFSSAANVRRYMRRAWWSRVKELNNTL